MKLMLGTVLALAIVTGSLPAQTRVTRYVRYSHQNAVAYGVLEGETIRELKGDLFAAPAFTGRTVKLADAPLLAPCQPSKVIAVGLNYKSHLGERPAASIRASSRSARRRSSARASTLSCRTDAKNVHFEGELVVVIGKRAKNVTVEAAPQSTSSA